MYFCVTLRCYINLCSARIIAHFLNICAQYKIFCVVCALHGDNFVLLFCARCAAMCCAYGDICCVRLRAAPFFCKIAVFCFFACCPVFFIRCCVRCMCVLILLHKTNTKIRRVHCAHGVAVLSVFFANYPKIFYTVQRTECKLAVMHKAELYTSYAHCMHIQLCISC